MNVHRVHKKGTVITQRAVQAQQDENLCYARSMHEKHSVRVGNGGSGVTSNSAQYPGTLLNIMQNSVFNTNNINRQVQRFAIQPMDFQRAW